MPVPLLKTRNKVVKKQSIYLPSWNLEPNGEIGTQSHHHNHKCKIATVVNDTNGKCVGLETYREQKCDSGRNTRKGFTEDVTAELRSGK